MVAVKVRQLVESRLVWAMSLLWLATLGAYTLEPVLFPVVKEFVVTSVAQEGGTVIASGVMRKSQRDCLFAGVVAYQKGGGERVHVPLLFQDATTDQTANRPAGYQPRGPWRMEVNAKVPGVIYLESIHKCHIGWVTTTPLTAIPVGATP